MQAVAGDVTFAVAVPVVSGLPIHPRRARRLHGQRHLPLGARVDRRRRIASRHTGAETFPPQPPPVQRAPLARCPSYYVRGHGALLRTVSPEENRFRWGNGSRNPRCPPGRLSPDMAGPQRPAAARMTTLTPGRATPGGSTGQRARARGSSGTAGHRLTRRSRHRPAELVLGLSTELDLINRTHSCQGRSASLTHSSCALILGADRQGRRRQEGFR